MAKETFLQVARVYRQLAGQLDARSWPPLKTRPSNRNGDSAAQCRMSHQREICSMLLRADICQRQFASSFQIETPLM